MFDEGHDGGDGDDPEHERRHRGVSTIAERALWDTVGEARRTGTCISCTVMHLVGLAGSHWMYNFAQVAASRDPEMQKVLFCEDESDEGTKKLAEAMQVGLDDMIELMRSEFQVRMTEGIAKKHGFDLSDVTDILNDLASKRASRGSNGEDKSDD